MLQLATLEEIEEVIDLCEKFHYDCPYKDYTFDRSKVGDTIFALINDKNRGLVLMTMDQGKPVGVLVAVASELPTSRDKASIELAFYIEPEYRKGTRAVRMLEAYEFWANKIGCKVCQVALLEDDNSDKVEQFYLRNNYKPLERAFIKEIK